MQISGLEQQFAKLEPGDHLGMVYQDIDEKLSVVGPFVKEGRLKGAQCIYVADESTAEEVADAINSSSFDIPRELMPGTLRFLTKWEYRQGKELEPDAMVPVIKSLVDQALIRGCPELWLAVEMTWTLEPAVDQEQLLRWEAMLDDLLEGTPAVVLCLYNHNQMAPSVLHSALRTHPLMVGNGSVCQNPYYDPPDLILSREARLNKKVDWMLSQLQRFQQQQQALADSEKQYRLLAENARDVVYLQRLVPEVGFEYVSPSVTDFTGYTPEHFYANPGLMHKLVYSEDRHLMQTMMEQPESFTGPVLLRWIHQDGTMRWAENNIAPIYDEAENLIALQGIVRDATERKWAEEARIRLLEVAKEEEEREHLKALIDISPVGVLVVDAPAQQVSLVNPELQRIQGLSYQPGKTLDECDRGLMYWKPDGQAYDPGQLPIRRTLGHGEIVRAEEVKTELPDGRIIPTLVNTTPIYSGAGQVVGAISIVQDLTPLEELEKLRNEFLGMVSHELRTPLSTIKGAAATGLRSWGSLSPGEVQEFFEIVEKQADHLTDLVNNLLDMSRIEAGAFAVNAEPADLPSALEEAITRFSRIYSRHQVQLQTLEGLPAVKADRRRIVQVLINLLSNAASVAPPTAPIIVELEHDASCVTLRVRDHGRSLPQERLSRLFKKFTQVNQNEGVGNSRIGLGLPICKGIVEAHGGQIWADSPPEGSGTTISFTLPRVVEAVVSSLVAAPAGASRLEGTAGQNERFQIMVVDDDRNALRFLRRLLEGAGYRALLTSDPEEALELVEVERPDLALLDMMLPGANGLDLMRSIREFSSVPVIFLTARDTRDDMVSALKMGGDDYITKPFSESELLARIEAVLRRKAMAGAIEATPPYTLDGLSIDFDERRVAVDGREVSLSAMEYKLLHHLTRNAGRVLTHDQILQLVWGRDYSGETDLLRSTVRRLRQKLGDDAQRPRYIFTIPQVGYRIPMPSALEPDPIRLSPGARQPA